LDHQPLKKGQATSDQFRPCPEGQGQGTTELIQIVQYLICRLRITACITQGLESNDLAFAVKIIYTMAPKSIDTLKKGLAKFLKQIKARKDEFNAKLLRRETISPADEEWLDHEANTVDEQHVLDELEAASDYERGFERLSEDKKAAYHLIYGGHERAYCTQDGSIVGSLQ
jgi:hypothetical protein